MSLLFLDFETRSEADLPSVGAYRYAEDVTTEILCTAMARDDDPAEVVSGWSNTEWERRFDDDVVIVAHNVEFEKSILREVLGWDLPISSFIDTAAMSARMSLPRKLEDVAKFFGLDTAAKDAGKKAIQSLSKPRKPTKKDPSKWVTREARPDLFEMLEARCKQDVEITRAIYYKLFTLEESERKIWQVTIRMNERGLLIDRASIPPAHALLEAAERPQVEEFERLTGGIKLKSYVKLAAWAGLPDVGKSTVRKALRGDLVDMCGDTVAGNLPPDRQRALSIYQGLNKSSIAKLDAMLDRMNGDDRVRGSFVYGGAERTTRWSASGIQPQNFTRGLGGETEVAFRALHSGLLTTLFEGCPRPPRNPRSR